MTIALPLLCPRRKRHFTKRMKNTNKFDAITALRNKPLPQLQTNDVGLHSLCYRFYGLHLVIGTASLLTCQIRYVSFWRAPCGHFLIWEPLLYYLCLSLDLYDVFFVFDKFEIDLNSFGALGKFCKQFSTPFSRD